MKRSLVFLVVTLIAIAFVWWFEVRPESKVKSTDEDTAASKTLTGLQKEEMKGFTLQKGASPAITVEKVRDAWELTAPVKASADEGSVNSVLWDLEGTEKDTTIDPKLVTPEKLGLYGLAKPAGSIDVMRTDQKTGEVKTAHYILGGPSPDGARIYVRDGNDGPVYLVPKKLADNLNKTVFEMRNKSIITLVATQIGSVKLFGPTKALLKKEGNLWNLEEPLLDYADPQTVQDLLKNAAALSIVSFVSEDAATFPQYGLDKPEKYITVAEGLTGKTTTVNFGKDAPAAEGGDKLVYACLAGGHTVFTLKSDAVAKVFPPMPDLQCKTLLRMDPMMLKQVNYSAGLNEVELKRPDYDWRISKPYDADASNEAVQKVLDTMTEAKYTSFVSAEVDPKYGFDKPQGSFTYVQADKAPTGVIFGADAGDGFVYAKRSDTPGVFKASGSLLATLKTPTIMLHTLDMQKVNMMVVDTMTIARADRTYTLKHDPQVYGEGAWKVTSPVSAPANNTMMTDLTTSLAVTRAVEIVDEKATDFAKYGLDKPTVKLSVTVQPGKPQPNALLVGSALEGSKRYAMIDGTPLVFTIPSGFARALFDEPRDPRILQFKVADATSIEYTKGDKKYVLKKVSENWVLEQPESSQVDQPTVTGELARLAGLTTGKFVDFTTQKLADYGLEKPQAVVRVVLPTSVAALSVGNIEPSTGCYYATSTTVDGIFLLTPGDVSKIITPERIALAKPVAEAAMGEAGGEAERSQAIELQSTGTVPVKIPSIEPPKVTIEPGAESAPQATGEGAPQSGSESVGNTQAK